MLHNWRSGELKAKEKRLAKTMRFDQHLLIYSLYRKDTCLHDLFFFFDLFIQIKIFAVCEVYHLYTELIFPLPIDVNRIMTSYSLGSVHHSYSTSPF